MQARTRENLTGFALIAPFLCFFCVFLLWPFFYSFLLSLHKTTIYSDWYNRLRDMKFVGLANYAYLLLHDVEFWWSLLMTLYYALLTIPTSIGLSLLLAVLLSGPVWGRSIFRSGFFLPQVLDLLVIGIIWSLLFSPRYGFVDVMLHKVLGGLSRRQIELVCFGSALVVAALAAWVANSWLAHRLIYEERFRSRLTPALIWAALALVLYAPMHVFARGFAHAVAIPYLFENKGLLANPATIMPCIALVVVLKGCGFGMILFLTTIQQIPRSIYEAADVDGATPWQKFSMITLPLVRPIILFLSVTGLMQALNAFTEIYAMTMDRGGPATEFLGHTVLSAKITGYYLFTSFRDQFYGRAAAISFILLIVAVVISAINFAFLRRRD